MTSRSRLSCRCSSPDPLTAGADYVSPTSPVTFAPNVPLVTLKVMPIKDALKEGEETVTITLVAKSGTYLLGDEKNATATIADAGSASGPGAPSTTPSMPPLPPADRTGTLSVTIAFDGRGSWKHPKNGAYSKLKFHRELTYTIPLRGT